MADLFGGEAQGDELADLMGSDGGDDLGADLFAEGGDSGDTAASGGALEDLGLGGGRFGFGDEETEEAIAPEISLEEGVGGAGEMGGGTRISQYL